jgi:hypothetical protein
MPDSRTKLPHTFPFGRRVPGVRPKVRIESRATLDAADRRCGPHVRRFPGHLHLFAANRPLELPAHTTA